MEFKNLPQIHNLQLEIRQEWGSENADHRLQMRRHIQERFILTNSLQALTLAERPKLAHGFVGISHCPGLGGYAYADTFVGLDIEDVARIKATTVARVATPQEMQQAPNPASLWCAKEAIFKALPSDRQPPPQSAVRVAWSSRSGEVFFTLADAEQFSLMPGHGYLTHYQNFLIAIFMATPRSLPWLQAYKSKT